MNESQKEDLKDPRVPAPLYWDIEMVVNWVEWMGFPQYKECFRFNLIDGKKLVYLDASHLPKIGIYDFEHIKVLAKGIRELLHIEDPNYWRSISYPPREPLGMYLECKSRTGEGVDKLSFKTHLSKFGPKSGTLWAPPLANVGTINALAARMEAGAAGGKGAPTPGSPAAGPFAEALALLKQARSPTS